MEKQGVFGHFFRWRRLGFGCRRRASTPQPQKGARREHLWKNKAFLRVTHLRVAPIRQESSTKRSFAKVRSQTEFGNESANVRSANIHVGLAMRARPD